MKKTVVVGVSGGVDSSVAALLLKQQGYNVVGMFLKNWEEEDENGVCHAQQDYQDAVSVCEKIGIPYYAIEFVEEYRQNVFNQFVAEYKKGLTPNPDILCNREIKFNLFLKKALEVGADYLATGHYCRNELVEGQHSLLKGVDPGKDQSYFLYTIKKEILAKVLFPVGGLLKKEVRKIAADNNFKNKDKKDSTGICFIGERNFRQFLSTYIPAQPGNFENLAGEVVGRHMGAAYYTLGQRKGLGLGGPGAPWYVVSKDMSRNVVIVERGEHHPALFCDYIIADTASWVAGDFAFSLPFACQAKLRYRQKDQRCTIESMINGQLRVSFEIPQRAATPGQSIVFYSDQLCLGGAVIIKTGPSYFEMNKQLPDQVSD